MGISGEKIGNSEANAEFRAEGLPTEIVELANANVRLNQEFESQVQNIENSDMSVDEKRDSLDRLHEMETMNFELLLQKAFPDFKFQSKLREAKE